MGLLIEPTHMEGEDEEQENIKKMRETVKSAEYKVEEYQDI